MNFKNRGDWGSDKLCANGQFITGIKYFLTTDVGIDGFHIYCNYTQLVDVKNGDWDETLKEYNVNNNKYVCGGQIKYHTATFDSYGIDGCEDKFYLENGQCIDCDNTCATCINDASYCLICDQQCQTCTQSSSNCEKCSGNRLNPPVCSCPKNYDDVGKIDCVINEQIQQLAQKNEQIGNSKKNTQESSKYAAGASILMNNNKLAKILLQVLQMLEYRMFYNIEYPIIREEQSQNQTDNEISIGLFLIKKIKTIKRPCMALNSRVLVLLYWQICLKL
ncbi:Vitelline membrane outer layer protein I (VOMI) [Pseudocohnilembus persalinus]|uniref:Vitelline membrane outer layer protein I (VOMI) n=1 Tax=Pseudocohnilembus persalinus TaxID=266149 RepID=A0A0V0QR44_PSEPJ|nr:Vitelline membrane outer layer protein I (VOMI) [Pseudocohnilembus persalinus]|eukprot:KRX04766.1 Vitelline membrane outer layer protein I (VOMI) [Pseudocohnilembus persalinus]